MIEDYRVDAAWAALPFQALYRSEVRKMLEAAASAVPPKPEIVVTEEMRRAGWKYWYDTPATFSRGLRPHLENIYRAMKALDPDLKRPTAREAPPVYFHRGNYGCTVPNERKGKERRADSQLWAGIRGSGQIRAKSDRRNPHTDGGANG